MGRTPPREVSVTPLAKLSAPRLLEPVPRPRLGAQFAGFAGLPAVWVEGPAGSGKTTAVADTLRARGIEAFWYHVDEGDRDPSALIAYLVQLAGAEDGQAGRLPFLTPEHLADLEGFGREFFRQFFRLMPADAVLVFENCHRADGDAFRVLLRTACEEVPPDRQIFMLSRHRLPALFAKLRLNRQIGIVSAGDLRLDLTETRAVLAAARSGASPEALHRLCDGWVAGLVLVLHREASADLRVNRLDLTTREALFEYFAGEILAAAPGELRRFLLRTAILPVMTPALANAVTGQADAADVLEQLHRRHSFTSRREGGAPVYTYHDLFRAFLLERLTRETAPAVLTTLQGVAARALEAAGFVAEAVELFDQASDAESVCRLIAGNAQTLIDQGRLQTLGLWLERVLEARIAADPWLSLFRGIATGLTDPVLARVHCERAYEGFVRTGDEAGQFAAVFSVMEIMLVISDSFAEWDRWIAAMEPLLESRPPADPSLAVRAWYAFLYMRLYRRPGHRLLPQARAQLESALFAGRVNSTQAIQAATGLLACAHFASDEALAGRVIPELRRLLDTEHLAVFSRLWGSVWFAVYHYFDARYEISLEWATLARDLAAASGLTNISQIMTCYRLQSLGNLGRPREALQEAQAVRPQVEGAGLYLRAYLTSVIGLNQFVDGQCDRAIETGEQCLDLWRQNGFLIAEYAWECIQAVYLLDAGRGEEALARVAHAERGVAGTLCNYLDPLFALLRSRHARDVGDPEVSREHLRSALTMARNRKRAAALAWARPMLPEAFATAWGLGIEPEVVRALAREWSVTPPAGLAPEAWPWPVVVKVLGGFGLQIRGIAAPPKRKVSRRLVSLLGLLAASAPRGVPMGRIADALWPESEGDHALGNARTALTRLRDWLEDDDAVEVRDGVVRLRPDRVWTDVGALDGAIARGAADEVRALYRGPILPDEDSPWVLGARAELHAAVSRFMVGAAGR